MNPFTQLVSPQAQAEAIAASPQLQGLPGYAYHPLDKEHGPWRRQPLPLRPNSPGDKADEESALPWTGPQEHLQIGRNG